jgi:hypothetical protein
MAPIQIAQQEQQPAADADNLEATAPEKLSLPELLRIMDVATTLRKEQEVVEEQLNFDQIKARLRERLLEAAKVAGEPVTPEQIDAAIDEYYDKLHSFEQPQWTFSVLLAHLYVRRATILKWLIGIAAVWALTWSLLVSGLLPGEARNRNELERLTREINTRAAAVRVLAADEMVQGDVEKLLATVETYQANQEPAKLDQVLKKLTALEGQLEAEYQIVVVNQSGQQSGIDRYYTDDQGERVSGYYLLLEARTADGRPVQVPIINRETGKMEQRSQWAELVPQEVYNRVAADKQVDGVLDESAFATKQRGQLEPQVTMSDEAGQPLVRRGQITSW